MDTSLVAGGSRTLRRVLVGSSIAAVLLSALGVVLTVRVALRPLGHRGRAWRAASRRANRGSRLRPTRTDTEIGQTARRFDEMLDELEGAELRARQAEERTRTFLADAAHELRTPLAGDPGGGRSPAALTADELDTAQRQQLEVLLIREAQRAGTLVSDLLATARLDAGVELHREPVSLAELARSEADRVRLLAPQATVRRSGTDVVVPADRDQLAGVVRNLTDNAIRAAGPRGSIELRTGVESGLAHLELIDSGPGIPIADRERVFDRMVRLDSARQPGAGGSGLGLAIARGYARAHGGDLVCLDRADGAPGARFRLTLPLAS